MSGSGTGPKALARINLSLRQCMETETKKEKTAREAWLNPERAYEDKGTVQLVGLYSSLFKIKFEDFHQLMQGYIECMLCIAEQLENVGELFKNNVIARIILGGFPEQYKALVLGLSFQSTIKCETNEKSYFYRKM